MSTSPNLPAGFSITSINGQRCTAVPRSLTTLSGSAATTSSIGVAAVTTISTSLEPTASSAQLQSPPLNPVETVVSTTAVAVSVTQASVTSASSPTFVVNVSTSEPLSSSQTALPASKGTTPTKSSPTSPPIAQSELHSASPTALNNQNGFQTVSGSKSSQSLTATANAVSPAESSASAGISSNPRLTPGPVVGGVIGGIALVGIVGFLVWLFRRRRRYNRDSMLTPLGTGREKTFYEIDNGSVGPTKLSTRLGARVGYQTGKIRDAAAGLGAAIAGFGATLKSKVVGDRSETPSINLNRGNSQFLDGPIPQHSRNNSVLSNNTGQITFKERFNDWWEQFAENVISKWRLRREEKEPADPFAAARGMTEKQAELNEAPNFSQLLDMDDHNLELRPERRSISLPSGNQLGASYPSLGSLGLNFESSDPFADPVLMIPPKTLNKPWAPPNPGAKPANINPFADPVVQPQPSIQKQNTYKPDIRRSRGQSIDTTNNNNNVYRPSSAGGLGSRIPSSIAPSRDSYRDTVFSSFSGNARKGKGRSDPFDLERPELWRGNNLNNMGSNMPSNITSNHPPLRASSNLYPDPLQMNSLRGDPPGLKNSSGVKTRQVSVQQPRIVSNTSFASKYSSGVSSLGEWGDPGPDLGGNSSSRGNPSSNGSYEFSAKPAKGVYGEGGGGINGSLAEIGMAYDQRRAQDNVSPLSFESKASSKGGVGKAM
jgi:hypothetical protein